MVVIVRFPVLSPISRLLSSRFRNGVNAKCPSCLRVCSVRRIANLEKCSSFVAVLVKIERDLRPGGIATIVCPWKNVESSRLPYLPRDAWCLAAGDSRIRMAGGGRRWSAVVSGGVKWSAFSGQCRH
jgi:hypothetical protein